MKITVTCLLLVGLVSSCLADDALKQVTKISKGPLNVEAEIKAYYLQLTTGDTDVQKQVQTLTAKSQDQNGGIYHAYEPHVVEWFPTESNWDVGKGASDMTGRFLVIQNVGYGRGKRAGYDTALMAEFEAVEESTSTKLDPRHESRTPKVLSAKLTLRFLGFRNASLSPASNLP